MALGFLGQGLRGEMGQLFNCKAGGASEQANVKTKILGSLPLHALCLCKIHSIRLFLYQ